MNAIMLILVAWHFYGAHGISAIKWISHWEGEHTIYKPLSVAWQLGNVDDIWTWTL